MGQNFGAISKNNLEKNTSENILDALYSSPNNKSNKNVNYSSKKISKELDSDPYSNLLSLPKSQDYLKEKYKELRRINKSERSPIKASNFTDITKDEVLYENSKALSFANKFLFMINNEKANVNLNWCSLNLTQTESNNTYNPGNHRLNLRGTKESQRRILMEKKRADIIKKIRHNDYNVSIITENFNNDNSKKIYQKNKSHDPSPKLREKKAKNKDQTQVIQRRTLSFGNNQNQVSEVPSTDTFLNPVSPKRNKEAKNQMAKASSKKESEESPYFKYKQLNQDITVSSHEKSHDKTHSNVFQKSQQSNSEVFPDQLNHIGTNFVSFGENDISLKNNLGNNFQSNCAGLETSSISTNSNNSLKHSNKRQNMNNSPKVFPMQNGHLLSFQQEFSKEKVTEKFLNKNQRFGECIKEEDHSFEENFDSGRKSQKPLLEKNANYNVEVFFNKLDLNEDYGLNYKNQTGVLPTYAKKNITDVNLDSENERDNNKNILESKLQNYKSNNSSQKLKSRQKTALSLEGLKLPNKNGPESSRSHKHESNELSENPEQKTEKRRTASTNMVANSLLPDTYKELLALQNKAKKNPLASSNNLIQHRKEDLMNRFVNMSHKHKLSEDSRSKKSEKNSSDKKKFSKFLHEKKSSYALPISNSNLKKSERRNISSDMDNERNEPTKISVDLRKTLEFYRSTNMKKKTLNITEVQKSLGGNKGLLSHRSNKHKEQSEEETEQLNYETSNNYLKRHEKKVNNNTNSSLINLSARNKLDSNKSHLNFLTMRRTNAAASKNLQEKVDTNVENYKSKISNIANTGSKNKMNFEKPKNSMQVFGVCKKEMDFFSKKTSYMLENSQFIKKSIKENGKEHENVQKDLNFLQTFIDQKFGGTSCERLNKNDIKADMQKTSSNNSNKNYLSPVKNSTSHQNINNITNSTKKVNPFENLVNNSPQNITKNTRNLTKFTGKHQRNTPTDFENILHTIDNEEHFKQKPKTDEPKETSLQQLHNLHNFQNNTNKLSEASSNKENFTKIFKNRNLLNKAMRNSDSNKYIGDISNKSNNNCFNEQTNTSIGNSSKTNSSQMLNIKIDIANLSSKVALDINKNQEKMLKHKLS